MIHGRVYFVFCRALGKSAPPCADIFFSTDGPGNGSHRPQTSHPAPGARTLRRRRRMAHTHFAGEHPLTTEGSALARPAARGRERGLCGQDSAIMHAVQCAVCTVHTAQRPRESGHAHNEPHTPTPPHTGTPSHSEHQRAPTKQHTASDWGPSPLRAERKNWRHACQLGKLPLLSIKP